MGVQRLWGFFQECFTKPSILHICTELTGDVSGCSTWLHLVTLDEGKLATQGIHANAARKSPKPAACSHALMHGLRAGDPGKHVQRRLTWGMIASWRRRASSPMRPVSAPSSRMRPEVTSIRRNSASMSEDLPLPVLPTTPQLAPAWAASHTQSAPTRSYLKQTLVKGGR